MLRGTPSATNNFELYGVTTAKGLYKQMIRYNTTDGTVTYDAQTPIYVSSGQLVADIALLPSGDLLVLASSSAGAPNMLFQVTQGSMNGSMEESVWSITPLSGNWKAVSVAQDGVTLLLVSAADGTLWFGNANNLSTSPIQSAGKNPDGVQFLKIIQMLDGTYFGVGNDNKFYQGTGPTTNIVWKILPTNAGSGYSVAQAPTGLLFVIALGYTIFTTPTLGGSWTSQDNGIPSISLAIGNSATPPVGPSGHSGHSGQSGQSGHSGHSGQSGHSGHSGHSGSTPFPPPLFMRNPAGSFVLCNFSSPPSTADFTPATATFCSASSAAAYNVVNPRLATSKDCWCVSGPAGAGMPPSCDGPACAGAHSAYSSHSSASLVAHSSSGLSEADKWAISLSVGVAAAALIVGLGVGLTERKKRLGRTSR